MTFLVAILIGGGVLGGALLWHRKQGGAEPRPEGVGPLKRLWYWLLDALQGESDPHEDLQEFAEFAAEHSKGATGPQLPPPHERAADPSPNGSPTPEQVPVHIAQADFLHAIHGLASMARTGDITVKRRVVATIAAGVDAVGSEVGRIARDFSDQHYGHEIWEPLAAMGSQCRSSSMHGAQALAMVDSLLRMSGHEMAQSPRRIPHHSQYNGGSQ